MAKKLTYFLLTLLVIAATATAGAAQAAPAAPSKAGPLKGVTAVAAGASHTCAIANKKLYCWGQNYGQLGDGTVTSSRVPIRVWGVGSDVRKVAAAQEATCAETGKALKCWGNINGENPTSVLPMPVSGAKLPLSSIAMGQDTGANGPMQLCAIFSASLACGDLGLTHRLAPVADLGGEPSMSAPGGPNCAVVSGAAKCWGDGFGGKLGNGSDASVSTPTTVTGLGQGVTKIAIGDFQVCAIVNAAVKCWGSLLGKERTQLGTPNSNVPVDVPNLTSGVTDIAAGSTFTCAIINGGVSCWGWDVKVGTGTDLDKDSSWDPVPVPGLESGVTSLSAGRGHICAIASGLLKCWGANSLGQLGTGGTISGLTPQTVVAPGPTIHAKLQKKVGAGLRADYGSSVYVHVAYSIPKHVQVKGACDARVTITMTGDGFSPRKGNTKFKRSASGCGATWQFATPATASDEVNIAVRSRGNWLLRPSVLKTTATYCEDRECP